MTSTLVHSTGSSGYLATPFAAFSTAELASLASGGIVISSSSFSQTNTGGGILGKVWFNNASTSGVQQTAGANISGWWLSADASGVFENCSTVVGMPRPPDFIIPFPSTSTTISTAGNNFAMGSPPLPWENFKVAVQNNLGVTMSATPGQVFIGSVSDRSV